MEDVIYTLLLMTFILQQKGPIRFLRQENGQGEWERPRERRKRGRKMEDVQRKSSLSFFFAGYFVRLTKQKHVNQRKLFLLNIIIRYKKKIYLV